MLSLTGDRHLESGDKISRPKKGLRWRELKEAESVSLVLHMEGISNRVRKQGERWRGATESELEGERERLIMSS